MVLVVLVLLICIEIEELNREEIHSDVADPRNEVSLNLIWFQISHRPIYYYL